MGSRRLFSCVSSLVHGDFNKLIDTDNRRVVIRGEEGGGRMKRVRGLKTGLWLVSTRNGVYQCCIIKLYTWKLYNVINQYYLSTLN